jgi:hypothetical protein
VGLNYRYNYLFGLNYTVLFYELNLLVKCLKTLIKRYLLNAEQRTTQLVKLSKQTNCIHKITGWFWCLINGFLFDVIFNTQLQTQTYLTGFDCTIRYYRMNLNNDNEPIT